MSLSLELLPDEIVTVFRDPPSDSFSEELIIISRASVSLASPELSSEELSVIS